MNVYYECNLQNGNKNCIKSKRIKERDYRHPIVTKKKCLILPPCVKGKREQASERTLYENE